MKNRKYALPDFLRDVVSQHEYEKWLRGRTVAHVKRDKKRGNVSATGEKYRMAIHCAVIESKGKDAYTGEELDWKLLSKFSNEEAKREGRKYKAKFALLPTVDHVSDGRGPADFAICAWRTNDSKGDLSLEEFVKLCNRVVRRNSRF